AGQQSSGRCLVAAHVPHHALLRVLALLTDTVPGQSSTPRLHDALPICCAGSSAAPCATAGCWACASRSSTSWSRPWSGRWARPRSEEHTSELQSREKLACRLLLERKKRTHQSHTT